MDPCWSYVAACVYLQYAWANSTGASGCRHFPRSLSHRYDLSESRTTGVAASFATVCPHACVSGDMMRSPHTSSVDCDGILLVNNQKVFTAPHGRMIYRDRSCIHGQARDSLSKGRSSVRFAKAETLLARPSGNQAKGVAGLSDLCC